MTLIECLLIAVVVLLCVQTYQARAIIFYLEKIHLQKLRELKRSGGS